MPCLINTGYSLGCRDNLGGIQKVYIRNWSASTTWNADSTGTLTGGTNTSTSWYTFEQRNETAEFIPGEGAHSLENGTNYWTETVNLVFHKYQASQRNLLYTLAQTEVEVIVLTQTGQYFLVGEQNGANLTASKSSVGKGFGDLNGTTLTLTAKELKPAAEMSSTFISTLTFV